MYTPILPLWAAFYITGMAAFTLAIWVHFVVTMGTNLVGRKKVLVIAGVVFLLSLAVFGLCFLPGPAVMAG
jgi:hypothetical protein